MVGRLDQIPDDAYLHRAGLSAVITPTYIVGLVNEARRLGSGLCFAHTHPGAVVAEFSSIDDEGERNLIAYLRARLPHQPHVTLVATASAIRCRQLGGTELDAIGIGRTVEWIGASGASTSGADRDLQFDRQVRVFGQAAQVRLGELRVAIVGLGGTGSVVASQLAHLGVQQFILVDADVVETSNLNRLVGASAESVGRAKVEVASGAIRRVNSQAVVDSTSGDVVDDRTARMLAEADVVFCCTDTHSSRAVINQIAYQYLVPVIDVGVAIHATGGTVTAVVGRVQLLSPGEPCLLCCGWIDPQRVRIEMQDAVTRARDPYVVGEAVIQPAVISLNSTVSSLAVTMFLSIVAGIPAEPRWLHYDALRGTVRPMAANPMEGCLVCSSDGARARGDSWELPTRQLSP